VCEAQHIFASDPRLQTHCHTAADPTNEQQRIAVFLMGFGREDIPTITAIGL